MNKWREALTEVADLSGWDLPKVANGDEAHLIRKAIEEVQNQLDHVHLHVTCHEIGLESRLQKLKLLLKMESDNVRIVAVWGMGGIGKTTIVKKLYNLIQRKFEGSCFLDDIRETSKSKQPNGLVVLQKKLLSGILRTDTQNIRNCHQGIVVIKQRACCRKVLLILDDVDNVQQLEALAIDRGSFGSGSRIVVTTRDKSLLNFLNVDEIYTAEELNTDESLELFRSHCFKEDHPTEDHLNLLDQVVHYAGGLPLALEILGRDFCGKSIPQWEIAIAKLRMIPPDDVQGKLKISFDSLNKDVQELFLDIACFFVGKSRDFTVKVLEGRNSFTKKDIEVLADRCLIKYDPYNSDLMMHDMVRDMGREIVRQESREDPGKRSRLWNLEDVLEVLRHGTGTEAVKGIQVNAKPFEKMDKLWDHESVLKVQRDSMGTEAVEGRLVDFNAPKNVQVNAKGFNKMYNLWLLHLDYVHLTTDFEHISRRLLWLSWKGFPLKCLPRKLSMEKLIALDLRYGSLKKVWNGYKLQSLPKLPGRGLVSAADCTSLESLPLELDQLGLETICTGSNKLVENDFANRLLEQLHRSKGLAELEGYVDIAVPTVGGVPSWFPYQGKGRDISFVVPPLAKQKLLGWVICVSFTSPEKDIGYLLYSVIYINKIEKKGLYYPFFKWFSSLTYQDQVWLRYTPQGCSGLHLQDGDEVEIKIASYNLSVVKNLGVDLIYEVDENITKTNENQEALIQYTSALNQNVSRPEDLARIEKEEEDFSLANK